MLRNRTILVVNIFQHDFVLLLFDANKQISAHVTCSSSLKYISNKQQMCIIRYERSFYFPNKSHYYLQFFSVITGRSIILAIYRQNVLLKTYVIISGFSSMPSVYGAAKR